MSQILRIAAAGIAMASLGVASNANAATTASANAEADILTALSVDIQTGDDTLYFGEIAPGASAVSIVVDPSTETLTGGCPSAVVCSGTPNAPTFNIAGNPGALVYVTFTNATEQLSNGTDTMDVTSLSTNLTSDQVTLSTGGTASFRVGGSLGVAASQAAGNYTGTLEVNVAYN